MRSLWSVTACVEMRLKSHSMYGLAAKMDWKQSENRNLLSQNQPLTTDEHG